MSAAPLVSNTTSASAPAAAAPSFGCDALPLLGAYRAAGVVLEQSASRLKLALTIDLHSLDCGAPDGYGEKLSLELEIAAEGEHCWLRGGTVAATPFGFERGDEKPWSDELRVDGTVDLALVEPPDVVLRGAATPRALVLTRHQYWLFEDVKPGAPLRQQLAGEDDDGKGCCFGFTSADASHWEWEHGHSVFSRTTPPASEGERAEFNTWATHSGLRHHLEALVRTGFRVAPDEKVVSKLAGDSRPLQVTVRVSPTNPVADDSIAVLQFSRKPCAACRDGVSGWWLWGAEARWLCQTEEGPLVEHPRVCP